MRWALNRKTAKKRRALHRKHLYAACELCAPTELATAFLSFYCSGVRDLLSLAPIHGFYRELPLHTLG